MLRFNTLAIAVLTCASLAGLGAAMARDTTREPSEQDEWVAIQNAKVSLSEAIARAEQETGGTAVEAALELNNGALAYQIETAQADGRKEVIIDLATGAVLKVAGASEDEDQHVDEDRYEDGGGRE